jgi:DNA transformation protein and related proteins
MNADQIRELFEPCGSVQLKRMFGGRGIYLNGKIIALEFEGLIWLKTDATTRPEFEKAKSRPFSYEKKSGEVGVMTYWLLPEEALDDSDAMISWVKLAEKAADSAAVLKSAKHIQARR